ncbi:MAG: GNAT family N-acetyltransferase [Pseudomonadaceae bacterium]|nr:GNAT family N-acetyltransferase [Pseudomonadaceae bacterium]
MLNRVIVGFGSELYSQMLEKRFDILRKPLGFGDFSKEDLEGEDKQVHLAFVESESILGGCVLVRGGSFFKLRQMFVCPSQQGRGIGRDILAFAEDYVLEQGGAKMVMHARKVAVPFYLKSGYSIQSDEFTEVGIPHVVMGKTLVDEGR